MNLRFRRSIVTGRSSAGIFRFQQETESEREVEQAVRAAWATDDVAEVTISVPRPGHPGGSSGAVREGDHGDASGRRPGARLPDTPR